MKSTIVEYGPCTIRAANCTTIAVYTKTTKGQGPLMRCDAATTDQAIAECKVAIDRILAERPKCATYGVKTPTTAEFKHALAVCKPKGAKRALLEALVDAGPDGITATNLAKAAGWEDHSAANLHLGILAEDLGAVAGVLPPRSTIDATRKVATAIVAFDGPRNTERRDGQEHWTWIARPELVAAMADYEGK